MFWLIAYATIALTAAIYFYRRLPGLTWFAPPWAIAGLAVIGGAAWLPVLIVMAVAKVRGRARG